MTAAPSNLPVRIAARVTFARQLRLARESAGLTQEQLAGACGCTSRSVGYWETAERVPNADMVPVLAEATGQRPAFFFGGDE